MLDAIYRALQAGEEPPISEVDMIATARLVDQIVALGKES
jgi:hypothetical protein